jgi:hypothetical protein
MMLQKRVERVMEWLKVKNKSKEVEEDIELEKKDILAIIISAFIVFLPIILLLIFAMFLLL